MILIATIIIGFIVIIVGSLYKVRTSVSNATVEGDIIDVTPTDIRVSEMLAEIDFHLSYDLLEKAEEMTREALREFPDDDRLNKKMRQIIDLTSVVQ